MSKIAVVYWSGTGNTQAMAEAVADGIRAAGAEADVLTPAETDAASVLSYDKIAFGCSAMGAEVLEESEFEPLFADVEGSLSGKKIALFGSYGWGDGEWMRDWQSRAEATGAVLLGEGLIINETPDDDGIAACKKLGQDIAAL